ncbi:MULTISPECIES: chromate efflux transporter [Halocynthiibacter]|uniref:Chromate efflux transporter n=1 Tax=Halocynthiibacter halioticoli TaxID=2986804 RepID=A0AAE3J129_9RHOB|nr:MULTISPECIES: chromate efflux transporter [Halocynthiibacter]MCV6824573.1 chromate efflux transporter [Halocynthiibacter halioticoli]MCW4057574.1 chromate efflux transporter [Halocynthiibacter sp. SDUM655004]
MNNPTLSEATRIFARIGLLSFGGPAAQIALMHKELVEERPWLSESQFLSALSFCMLLPGPEAMQLATYAGWRLHGVRGGLIAGALFVIPGAIVVLALAMAYALFGEVPLVEALFLGVKAAVVVIVIDALLKVSRRALKSPLAWGIAASSFIAIYVFALPYPLIVALAALIGAIGLRGSLPEMTVENGPATRPQTLKTVLTWGSLWAAPLALLYLSGAQLLTAIGLFFSKLAIVTFGGAYAVLAYMTQTVVAEHGWISTATMMDGLGLAETTPGPLILVTEFVGFQAAYNAGGMALGIAGALVALWMTFVPCFLWIFTFAPYLSTLSTRPKLSAALAGITAAVVGVILNLSFWFAAHVLFKDTTQYRYGWFDVLLPNPASLDLAAAGLAVLAGILMFVAKLGMGRTLLIMALAGLGLHTIGL